MPQTTAVSELLNIDPGEDQRDSAPHFESALLDALPGLEVLDHGLELDGLSTDAVGVDGEGRLNLVLYADGQADSLPLEVLDTLRLARRQRYLLARHLNEPRLDPEADACVVIVAPGFDALVSERLACLPKHQVRCFELHEMRSEKGLSTLLLPASHETVEHEYVAPAPEDFLSALDEPLREMVSELTLRIERIDREVALAPGPGGLEWRYRGTPLCRLRGEGEGLVGSVIEGPSFPLHRERDLEGFLDASLRRFLILMDTLGDLGPAALAPRPGIDADS